MELIPPPKKESPGLPLGRDSTGIALFMVIAAVSVLSILTTEFTYIAQINQKMAFDSLDQIKAHYLAKSGLKLSLLRLKAYEQVKTLTGGGSGAKASASNPMAGLVPKGIMEKIWSFPFFYPIPSLPGMTEGDKEQLDKFTKDSTLDGKFVATIESESSKYNLNTLLSAYAPIPTPSSSGQPPTTPQQPNQPQAAGSGTPQFSADAAKQSLQDYLSQMIATKAEVDEGFAHEYRDFKVDELVQNISLWADRTNTGESNDYKDEAIKKAPFYSITELHMIPTMDDELYNLFTPSLTATTTLGININTMQDTTLRALIPIMTKDEVAEFFKYRDSTEEDNLFKKEQDFWDYLLPKVAAFRNDKNQEQTFEQTLIKRGIHLVTDETQFKITVQATSNQSTRTIEAWVTLSGKGTASINPDSGGTPSASTPNAKPSSLPPPLSGTGGATNPTNQAPDSGLKITFMRIL